MALIETPNEAPIAQDAGPLGGNSELARFRAQMAEGKVPDLGTPSPAPPEPAAAAPAPVAAPTTPAPAPAVDDDDKPQPSGLSKRQQAINDSIRAAVEGATSHLRAEIEELRRGRTPAPAAQSEMPPTRPMPTEEEVGAKYQTYGAYVRDLAAWEFEQRDAARTHTEHATRADQAHQEAMTAYETTATAARTRHADFDEVVSRTLPAPLTPTIQNAILASDLGAELAYHLSTHHAEYSRIHALPVGRALMAMGALETQLRTGLEKPAAPAHTPTPPPPAPPMAPVNAGGIAGTPDVSSLNDLNTFRTVIKPKFGMRS